MMCATGRAAVFIAIVFVLAPVAARADVDSPLVKKGLAAYDELDYARAVQLLEQARNESLTREEKILTYRTLGMARVALGKTDEARRDFEHLLRLDPSYELERTLAPKVRAVFEQAKAEVAVSGRALSSAMLPLTPALSPAAPREGKPVTVHVTYTGGVARKMTVYFRRDGNAAFNRATVDGAPDGRFDAVIPGLEIRPPALDYHVVLLDDSGASVAAAGSIGNPLTIAVTRMTKPVYKRGWFWGVMGGIAAAGALAAGLAVGLPRSNSAPITVNPQ